MSYEILLLDPALAATSDEAAAMREAATYWDTSLPDHDRSARKWRIAEGLLAFNPALQRMAATQAAPRGAWLGKLTGGNRDERRYLAVTLPHGEDATDFTLFDQAVEVDFAQGVSVDRARDITREVWRHLRAMSDMGFATAFDAERNVLLDLERDFETVVDSYIANLKIDAEIDAADAAAERQAQSTGSARDAPASDGPFTGNVGTPAKPWWKLW